MKKRILFVAFGDSIHTARWITLLKDHPDFEISLFSHSENYYGNIHQDISHVKCFSLFYGRQKLKGRSLKMRGIPVFSQKLAWLLNRYVQTYQPQILVYALHLFIRIIKPHVVHSMEFQHHAYLVHDMKKKYLKEKPSWKWIASCWGSDLYLFRKIKKHEKILKEILTQLDIFHGECQRDLKLGQDMGFQGELWPVTPCTGGLDIEFFEKISQVPVLQRKRLLVKGYQHFSGRALFALEVIRKKAALLKDAMITVYVASQDVALAAELLAYEENLNIEVLPSHIPWEDLLKIHAEARVALALGMSDGIPNTFTESMALGTFPIQSCTSCVSELIEDGVSGFIVPWNDLDLCADRLEKAWLNDDLVEKAALINSQILKEKMDRKIFKSLVPSLYQDLMKEDKK